jgi:hypothetical protein
MFRGILSREIIFANACLSNGWRSGLLDATRAS